MTVTGALRAFDLVWITTQGGPGTSTTTPALLLYRKAFLNPDVGMAAAIGIILAVVCLLVAAHHHPTLRGEGRMISRAERMLNHTILAVVSILVLFPVVWFVFTALSPEPQRSARPAAPAVGELRHRLEHRSTSARR